MSKYFQDLKEGLESAVDFEKRARDAAEQYGNENDGGCPAPYTAEHFYAGVVWAQAELDNPIGSDFNEHYKQELLAEIDNSKLTIDILYDKIAELKAEIESMRESFERLNE